MHAVLKHANGSGTISIDSNARSTTWHNVLMRGKMLEKFLIGNHLHIANEESCNTSFETTRGATQTYLQQYSD